jgi:hypothetical protein
MFANLNRILDRLESRIALWEIARGSLVVGAGGMTGWLSTGVDWINQFGWFGWWAAFLVGCFLSAAALALLSVFRYYWVRGRAMDRWSITTSDINPLDDTFHKRRIKIVDLIDPADNAISGKTFTDCDLVGPANIVLLGGSSYSHVGFVSCDVVPTRRKTSILNAVKIQNISVVRGRFVGVTIFVPPPTIPMFREMNAPFVSFTEDELHQVTMHNSTE